jgi:hypothetical protein
MGHLSRQTISSRLPRLQTGTYRAARCDDGGWLRSVGLASEAIASCKRLSPITSEAKAVERDASIVRRYVLDIERVRSAIPRFVVAAFVPDPATSTADSVGARTILGPRNELPIFLPKCSNLVRAGTVCE